MAKPNRKHPINTPLPKVELERLRSLARQQAEVATLPVMAERRKKWMLMNDGVPGTRPPFAIESWTFDRDFMPESLFQCTSEQGRSLEKMFLRHIRHHGILNDDHVCPDTLDMGWNIAVDEFGIDIKTEYVNDAEGSDHRCIYFCIVSAVFLLDNSPESL